MNTLFVFSGQINLQEQQSFFDSYFPGEEHGFICLMTTETYIDSHKAFEFLNSDYVYKKEHMKHIHKPIIWKWFLFCYLAVVFDVSTKEGSLYSFFSFQEKFAII